MKVCVSNSKHKAELDEKGVLSVFDVSDDEKLFSLWLFGDDFEYLLMQWDVKSALFLDENSKYVVLTYGIGHVYFISIQEQRVIKKIQLFDYISYDDESYQHVEDYAYYGVETFYKASHTEKYLAIRCRGVYDPQETDAPGFVFDTPEYQRSTFIINLDRLEIVFKYAFDDVEERNGRNAAVFDFSPDEKHILIGALGNVLKVFSLETGRECGCFEGVKWHPYPLDIQNCEFGIFKTNDSFEYLNHNNQWILVQKQQDGIWRECLS